MCINSDYRKLGVGSQLFNTFKEWCKSENVKSIVVTASSQNINAINFYRKNLFDEYNTTLKYIVEEEK